jgi:hypothetical protein
MLKQTPTGSAVAGIIVMAAATTSVVVPAGSAAAATRSCTGLPHTVSRVCTAHTRLHAPLFTLSPGSIRARTNVEAGAGHP